MPIRMVLIAVMVSLLACESQTQASKNQQPTAQGATAAPPSQADATLAKTEDPGNQYVMVPQRASLYLTASDTGQAFVTTKRSAKIGSPLSKDDSFFVFRLIKEEEGGWLHLRALPSYDEAQVHCRGGSPEALGQLEVSLYVKKADVASVLTQPFQVTTSTGDLRLLPGVPYGPGGPLVDLALPEGYVLPDALPQAETGYRYAFQAQDTKRTEYIACRDSELRESKNSSCSDEANVYDLVPKGDDKKLFFKARLRTSCYELTRDDLHKGPLPKEEIRVLTEVGGSLGGGISLDKALEGGMIAGNLKEVPKYVVDAYHIEPGSSVYTPDGQNVGKVVGKDPVRFYFSADGSTDKRTCVRVLSKCYLVHDNNEACAKKEPVPSFSLCFDADKTTFKKVEEEFAVLFGIGVGGGMGMGDGGGAAAFLSTDKDGGKGSLRSDIVEASKKKTP